MFFSDLNFLKIYIKILSPVLQSMIRQSLLEPFCRVFFFYNSTRNFSSRERLFQIISNVRYLAVCKKRRKLESFGNTGKKWKLIPLKKYWEWFSLRAVHNNGKTIKNTGSGKGEIVIHRHWYLICKAPVSFWWSWTNELAPLMIFSPVLLLFSPSSVSFSQILCVCK